MKLKNDVKTDDDDDDVNSFKLKLEEECLNSISKGDLIIAKSSFFYIITEVYGKPKLTRYSDYEKRMGLIVDCLIFETIPSMTVFQLKSWFLWAEDVDGRYGTIIKKENK